MAFRISMSPPPDGVFVSTPRIVGWTERTYRLYCLKKWQIAIKCDGKSMMTDNYLNMKEILKLLIFNYIISDYSWSYGDHSISTFVYWLIYLFIDLSTYLLIYQSIYLIHNSSPISLCSVKACHMIKLPPVKRWTSLQRRFLNSSLSHAFY